MILTAPPFAPTIVQPQAAVIAFRADGDPMGQPRPRASVIRMGNSYRAHVYDGGAADPWKKLVKFAAMGAQSRVRGFTPLVGPLNVAMRFVLARPKSTHYRSGKFSSLLRDDAPRHHLQKPDLSNLIKLVEDVMTDVGVWVDDAHVVSYDGSVKVWADADERPGVEVCVTRREVPS